LSPKLKGKVEVLNEEDKPTISFDGNTGVILAGGNKSKGGLLIKSPDNIDRILMGLNPFIGELASISVGWNGYAGEIGLLNKNKKQTIHLVGNEGAIYLKDIDGKTNIILEPKKAYMCIRDTKNNDRINFYGDLGSIRFFDSKCKDVMGLIGNSASIYIGGIDNAGYIDLKDEKNKNRINLNGHIGAIRLLNTKGKDGIILFSDGRLSIKGDSANISIHDNEGKSKICLNGEYGNIRLGGNGSAGDLLVYPGEGDNFHTDQASIHLDGQNGDIKLSGADCAEDFNVLESEQIEPGMVLVVDNEDTLRVSNTAYDKKVVGVVSGAGDFRPGIIMNKKNNQNNRLPVALTGKVNCKVDADYSSIDCGDLLTTSPTFGHAMKAEDPTKAFGAVIGKALFSLKSGRGLIPILVALQ
jgi:hypothetical protein